MLVSNKQEEGDINKLTVPNKHGILAILRAALFACFQTCLNNHISSLLQLNQAWSQNVANFREIVNIPFSALTTLRESLSTTTCCTLKSPTQHNASCTPIASASKTELLPAMRLFIIATKSPLSFLSTIPIVKDDCPSLTDASTLSLCQPFSWSSHLTAC